MEEVTISIMLGILLAIVVELTPKERKSTVLLIGWVLLLIYFLVMPESY